MAPRDRRLLSGPAAQLLRRPADFDFFQAVRLLEEARPETVSLGTGSEPRREAVALRSAIGFEFPLADLMQAHGPDAYERTVLEVAFMGLAGADGPLPAPYTELVQQCARADGGVAGIDPPPRYGPDDDARDFLDIFNHRLLSFFYRARKKHRLALGASGEAPVERMLYRLIGFGEGLTLPWLRRPAALGVGVGVGAGQGAAPAAVAPAAPVASRMLLRYAGLLACQSRSMAGLLAMLADAFAVPVEGQEHRGRWLDIEPRFQSALGPHHGRNCALGVDMVLGARAWEPDGAIGLQLGPMDLEHFRSFLPGGAAHDVLTFLVRFYLRQDLDVQITLLLTASDAELDRAAQLNSGQLGWTTWLRQQRGARQAVASGPPAPRPSAAPTASATAATAAATAAAALAPPQHRTSFALPRWAAGREAP
ncbi:type VI secretion system baseplate subunit TssG [Rugamonas sp. CCM 8940]|uniref:type VI secretion system baseplate subunit TssG n=1 Tax=Rugamonas sp. CCM 8940 TaxID=2765359 RepID=UPI0018F603F8|nr:type VI secretion system baseplate subunit TssG [Rugamonas sp. CCM 8940]MBJ7313463.1 type VI secretion system baseplate subunit TssG [Rugamonas sp. CCM 8940]